MTQRRWPAGLCVAAPLLALGLAACRVPGRPDELAPTLGYRTIAGSQVAFQSGIPVPTFSFQPRLRLDLGGSWKVDRIPVDSDLSLENRARALPQIVTEAGGRQQPGYDDSRWDSIDVPGTLDVPPRLPATGAWYRDHFAVPAEWSNATVTLKFGAVNYIADVWLNGKYLGYHEGGSTPFAFDASDAVIPDDVNTLAVRVDNPPWGTRQDIVPWGLTDWWNYGGIVQPVWLEASGALYAARADVVPHLDGAEVSVVLHQRGGTPVPAAAQLEILPAAVTTDNLVDPDPRSLVPPDAVPIVAQRIDAGELGPNDTAVVHASFVMAGADLWSPDSPALYVLHVRTLGEGERTDDLYEAFGLRRIAVDAKTPRLLLNGDPTDFAGVAMHDEQVAPPNGNRPHSGPITAAGTALLELDKARAVNAQLIRADHKPANPILLTLADRLGFAIWEEIPLYHYTPLTFDTAMARGIPQQMLAEMDLRDMNHPAVLFHGLANESTGGAERVRAMTELQRIDRAVDGTRLTGQAAYGFDPRDATSEPLDVAGYTFYYGVFYGQDAATGTADALTAAHARYPHKPIMVLEFGRWADSLAEEPVQQRILVDTYGSLAHVSDIVPFGYLGGAVWWSLDDYWSERPGIDVEHFGLFTPAGRPRPAAVAAADLFTPGAGLGERKQIVSSARGRALASGAAARNTRFVVYLVYALGVSALILLAMLLVLARGTRSWQRA